MIKHFCDRCGVECERTSTIRIPIKNQGNGSYIVEDADVCPTCEKMHNAINDMLIDLKIVMFSKFLGSKGGE